jgi:hypothetical protein
MICRCCGQPLTESLQPGTPFTSSSGVTITTRETPCVTCNTENCQMKGYTLATATYADKDLSAYFEVS